MARKILLADDSVTAQNMGRKILADAGYEVIAVNNGSAALKKIAELKPDLVILDVYMPGYSGLEVCQRLKEAQESSRIPVLLSVGKLEPFKPEEAQRVRADGYIVKPFEASELLSALSKLEDKVVPRSEPSKPGRFARAIAAVEDSGRGGQNSEKNGWKSRIGFPHEKTEAAEKVDDSPIYNPMNRDLRTVVETPGEKVAEHTRQEEHARHEEQIRQEQVRQEQARQEQAGQEETRQQAEEASVDVAALAPAGLPKDVTPEEVAAIAAAAAQIQMAAGYGHGAAEPQAAETQSIEEPNQVRAEIGTSTSPSHSEETSIAAEPVQSLSAPEPEEQVQDEPVTMAVATESTSSGGDGSRWTAVPVALQGEETNISLEQEMQKAYAAFTAAAAEQESAPGASVAEAQLNPAESPATVETVAEAPVESISAPEAETVSQSEPAIGETMQAESAQPAVPEAIAIAVDESVSAHIGEPASAAEATAEASTLNQTPEPEHSPSVSEFMSPVSEAEVAGLAGIVGLSAESQLAAEAVSEAATAVSASVESAAAPAEQAEEASKPEAEDVKDTAAAWASWRQIRDTGNGSDVAHAQPKPPEVSEPAPAETAMAVAAGAEQVLQEASNVPDGSNDVASIVDSVLADLRPKLMAEISRKMAEKK